MTTTTIAKITMVVCLLAALIETVLGCTSTAGMTLGDSMVWLFFVGPYCLLALFAWRQRCSRAISWLLLVGAFGIAA